MNNQHFFSAARLAISSSPLRGIFVFAVINMFLIFTVNGQTKVKATGTGQTTGHIANLTVTNTTTEDLQINSQTAYIPSDGKYQSYVGTVPETTVPPGTSVIPVNGNCANVSSPPFPNGTDMSVAKWIPVGTVDQPLPEGTINILPMPTKPKFTPDDIPGLTGSAGYTLIADIPVGESGIIINWPDTNIPLGGVIDPDKYPEDFAPVIVEVLEDIIDAVDVILEDDHFDTPISGNPEKERESVIQQTFWIYMAAATGDEYTRNDFAGKVYDQFLTSTGKPVTSLPEEQKEKVDDGIVDFWNTFQATGVEAKVINKESPGIELISLTPKCECGDITYDLEVKRAGIVVHSDNHNADSSPKISIRNFQLGDILDIKITNIEVDCACETTDCEFYPAQDSKPGSTGSTKTDRTKPGKVTIHMENDGANTIDDYGNNNCTNKNKTWNSTGDEYSFTLETKDEKSKESSAFQRLLVKAYCELDECRRDLCKETIQLNFVKQ